MRWEGTTWAGSESIPSSFCLISREGALRSGIKFRDCSCLHGTGSLGMWLRDQWEIDGNQVIT
jgi:hypothetical protein